MKMRVAATAMTHNIKHKCFIINWDQSGIMLLSASNHTYANKTEKQVPLIGLDEKRQITAVVAGALSGELLPLQLIFTGQDIKKTQQKAVPTLDPITDGRVKGYGWHLTQTRNHWSSQDSMREYVRLIIDPWIAKKRLEHNCPDAHAILLFDCWSVHKSAEFLGWLSTTYPLYHPLFIPAGCTGKAQPADIVLQRPLKCDFTNEYTLWMNDQIIGLLNSGAVPSQIRVNTGMAIMKPLIVKWLMHSWLALGARTEMIQKGWTKAELGDVLEPAIGIEAMKLVLNRQVSLDNDGQQVETESISEADAAQLQAEMDMCDEDDDRHVEDDEEEIDTEVALVNCIEEKPFVGLRRSSRVSANAEERKDLRMSQLLQEQTLQEACIIFDN